MSIILAEPRVLPIASWNGSVVAQGHKGRDWSRQAGAAPAKQLAPLHARAMYGWVVAGGVNEWTMDGGAVV